MPLTDTAIKALQAKVKRTEKKPQKQLGYIWRHLKNLVSRKPINQKCA
jgi:hypothetical protein